MAIRPRNQDSLGADFTRDCLRLAREAEQFDPDVVVGIYTGGAVVADEMAPALPRARRVDVRLQRPATAVKAKVGAGRLLHRLPRPVAHLARWAEVELREATLSRDESDLIAGAQRLIKDQPLADAIAQAYRVLVVDDTIDSGRTLRAVQQAVHLLRPDVDSRTAVLASTWRRPPHRADYCLYDQTLLRLPWSLDATR